MKLPAAHELIAFFGSEPALADGNLPWAYNQLTFRVTTSDERLTVVVAAGFENVRLLWEDSKGIRLALDLGGVSELAVREEGRRAVLVVSSAVAHVKPLSLFLIPTVSVVFGTEGRGDEGSNR